MKTKFLIFAAIFSFALTSCKKDGETKTTDEPAAPAATAKQNFSVEIDASAEKEDDFALYYTEDSTINFDLEKVAWGHINAGNTSQKVTIDLPGDVIPTNIRFDFGLKKGEGQGDVTVSNIKIIHYGKTFEIRGSDFLKYFIENKDVKTEIDQAAGTIKFLKSDKSTPFYYPTQAMNDAIMQITK